jgi:lipoprotein-releasing system permease protein
LRIKGRINNPGVCLYNLPVFFEIKLARRFLRSRRRSLARFTSVVAVVGIAAGLAGLIVAQALARGFQSEINGKILGNTAHISVFLEDNSGIANWTGVKSELENVQGVVAVSATVYANAAASSDSSTSHAVLTVDQGLPSVVPGETATVSVGCELARKAGVVKGDRIDVTVFADGGVPDTATVIVGEVFETGMFEYDSTWIKISQADYANDFGGGTFTPSLFLVSVRDASEADLIADSIAERLGNGFRAVSWQEANRPLFAALSLERTLAFAVILLIIFIAALNITTTLALLVNERRADIAVLRTCGAKTRSLLRLFLFEGLILGIAGIALGVTVGLGACVAGNFFEIVRLPAEVYSVSHIPLRPAGGDVLAAVAAAFVLCLAATVYPAVRASRIKPLENLRSQ